MPVSNFTADDVLTAANMNLLPRGEMAYAQVTANQTGITTVVDATGLSATWTAVSSRRYRVTVHALITSTVASDVCQVTITNAANAVQAWSAITNGTTGFGETVIATKLVTGLSGSTTWKARILRQSGTGTISFVGDATSPAYIIVEDVGAA